MSYATYCFCCYAFNMCLHSSFLVFIILSKPALKAFLRIVSEKLMEIFWSCFSKKRADGRDDIEHNKLSKKSNKNIGSRSQNKKMNRPLMEQPSSIRQPRSQRRHRNSEERERNSIRSTPTTSQNFNGQFDNVPVIPEKKKNSVHFIQEHNTSSKQNFKSNSAVSSSSNISNAGHNSNTERSSDNCNLSVNYAGYDYKRVNRERNSDDKSVHQKSKSNNSILPITNYNKNRRTHDSSIPSAKVKAPIDNTPGLNPSASKPKDNDNNVPQATLINVKIIEDTDESTDYRQHSLEMYKPGPQSSYHQERIVKPSSSKRNYNVETSFDNTISTSRRQGPLQPCRYPINQLARKDNGLNTEENAVVTNTDAAIVRPHSSHLRVVELAETSFQPQESGKTNDYLKQYFGSEPLTTRRVHAELPPKIDHKPLVATPNTAQSRNLVQSVGHNNNTDENATRFTKLKEDINVNPSILSDISSMENHSAPNMGISSSDKSSLNKPQDNRNIFPENKRLPKQIVGTQSVLLYRNDTSRSSANRSSEDNDRKKFDNVSSPENNVNNNKDLKSIPHAAWPNEAEETITSEAVLENANTLADLSFNRDNNNVPVNINLSSNIDLTPKSNANANITENSINYETEKTILNNNLKHAFKTVNKETEGLSREQLKVDSLTRINPPESYTMILDNRIPSNTEEQQKYSINFKNTAGGRMNVREPENGKEIYVKDSTYDKTYKGESKTDDAEIFTRDLSYTGQLNTEEEEENNLNHILKGSKRPSCNKDILETIRYGQISNDLNIQSCVPDNKIIQYNKNHMHTNIDSPKSIVGIPSKSAKKNVEPKIEVEEKVNIHIAEDTLNPEVENAEREAFVSAFNNEKLSENDIINAEEGAKKESYNNNESENLYSYNSHTHYAKSAERIRFFESMTSEVGNLVAQEPEEQSIIHQISSNAETIQYTDSKNYPSPTGQGISDEEVDNENHSNNIEKCEVDDTVANIGEIESFSTENILDNYDQNFKISELSADNEQTSEIREDESIHINEHTQNMTATNICIDVEKSYCPSVQEQEISIEKINAEKVPNTSNTNQSLEPERNQIGSVDEDYVNPHHLKQVMALLELITERAKPFDTEIQLFTELEDSNKYYYIEESLRRLIDKLDDMFDDIGENKTLRNERKKVYKYIFPLFDKLDDKVKENKERIERQRDK